MARLIVFGPSHFCERARWGVDHAGVAYREERWVPGPHAVLARRLGLATTTPILVLDSGPAIQGSGRILDHAEIPGGDPDLERRFEDGIGPSGPAAHILGGAGRPGIGRARCPV